MTLVVGLILLPVLGVELTEPVYPLFERRRRWKVEEQGPHLGADEMIGTRCPSWHDTWCRLAANEVEHDVVIEPAPHHGAVGSGQPADHGGQRRRLGIPFRWFQRLEPRANRPEGLRPAVPFDELGRPGDEIQ